MKNKLEELKKAIQEAVPEITGRNTSVLIPKPFGGIINFKDDSITLADVLRAMGGHYAIESTGQFMYHDEEEQLSGTYSFYGLPYWNLTENLEGQSNELIVFLHSILVIKTNE